MLLPRCSLLALSGALDALQAANDVLQQAAYGSALISLDGRPVRAACGSLVAAAHGLADAPALDAVFVVSDLPLPDPLRDGHAGLHAWLRDRAAGGALMEANLGEPLPTEDIARLVGVSRRQLERLFKQHLDELPSRYYAELRLARARRLLQQTSQSILQVGLGCGFSSGSHFSNAYRTRFGRTPREERSQRAAAWRGQAGQARQDTSLPAKETAAP